MKQFITYLNLTLLMILAGLIYACSHSKDDIEENYDTYAINDMARQPAKVYKAELNTLNNSGVMGMAELILDGNQLTVTIYAQGLVPEMVHPQHIHGASENNGNGTCPPDTADTNTDGFVSVGEGVPYYGGVMQALTPFPMAFNEMIDFQETYTLNEPLSPLQNRAIVVHGMYVNGVYDPSMPVACGQIVPHQGKGS